jgi:hypothetical protein
MTTQRIAVLAGALFAVVLAPLGHALADVPQKLNDEGRLYDTTANAPATGSHTLTFTIYSAGGTSLWSQMSTVMVNDGFFAVTLDGTATGNTFPPGMFDGSELQLGLKVDSDAEMTPRQPLDSVPYAMLAGGLGSRPKCPAGYAQDTSITTFVDCKATLTGGQVDDMVRVGDYWIDRYEMSGCGGAAGMQSGEGTSAVGCSVSGVAPAVNSSWFQAQAMCVNAGKRLCTNAEWQAAARGTHDPGASDGTGGACLTTGSAVRNTGLGTACRSDFGAEDMIGNAAEWAAEWGDTGVDGAFANAKNASPWPPGMGFGDGSDATYNLNTNSDLGSNTPNAAIRGGGVSDNGLAGTFSYSMDHAPSLQHPEVAGRCCVGGAY